MSNSISFIGHLGADAELKHVGENTVLEFRVGNNVGFGDKKVTNWFRCALWGKRGQSVETYLRKGQQVFVTGELTLRNFTGKDGVEKLSAEIRVGNVDLCGGRGAGPEMEGSAAPAMASAARKPSTKADAPETDDDMPF